MAVAILHIEALFKKSFIPIQVRFETEKLLRENEAWGFIPIYSKLEAVLPKGLPIDHRVTLRSCYLSNDLIQPEEIFIAEDD